MNVESLPSHGLDKNFPSQKGSSLSQSKISTFPSPLWLNKPCNAEPICTASKQSMKSYVFCASTSTYSHLSPNVEAIKLFFSISLHPSWLAISCQEIYGIHSMGFVVNVIAKTLKEGASWNGLHPEMKNSSTPMWVGYKFWLLEINSPLNWGGINILFWEVKIIWFHLCL